MIRLPTMMLGVLLMMLISVLRLHGPGRYPPVARPGRPLTPPAQEGLSRATGDAQALRRPRGRPGPSCGLPGRPERSLQAVAGVPAHQRGRDRDWRQLDGLGPGVVQIVLSSVQVDLFDVSRVHWGQPPVK